MSKIVIVSSVVVFSTRRLPFGPGHAGTRANGHHAAPAVVTTPPPAGCHAAARGSSGSATPCVPASGASSRGGNTVVRPQRRAGRRCGV